MIKKAQTTVGEFLNSLSKRERKKFDEEHQELILSELLLALMAEDDLSVRQLAKMAKLSPTVIQSMRSAKKKDYTLQTFFKILSALGCNEFSIKRNNRTITIPITKYD